MFFTSDYHLLWPKTAFGGTPVEVSGYRGYENEISGTKFKDFSGVYGYGGPLGEYIPGQWVSEFARLHPFLENQKYLDPLGLVQSGEVVYTNVHTDCHKVRAGMDKGCWSAVNKAVREKVVVGVSYDIGQFQRLYTQTMERVNASEKYFFDDEFFTELMEMDQCALFQARQGQHVLAMAIILAQGDYAHYFLSGSELNSTGASNLLLYESMLWAGANGCKIFNLGGGVHGNDSLLSFKKSFSKLTKPFFTYRKVHDQEAYNWLCQRKGVQPTTDGYFPVYREP